MRDQYILTVPDKGDYEYIDLQVNIEEAENAYQRISELTGVTNEDILGIYERDNEKQTIRISLDYRAVVPTVAILEQINAMNRFAVKIKEETFLELMTLREDLEPEAKKVISDATDLDEEVFNLCAAHREKSIFIIEIPTEVEVETSDIVSVFSHKNTN